VKNDNLKCKVINPPQPSSPRLNSIRIPGIPSKTGEAASLYDVGILSLWLELRRGKQKEEKEERRFTKGGK